MSKAADIFDLPGEDVFIDLEHTGKRDLPTNSANGTRIGNLFIRADSCHSWADIPFLFILLRFLCLFVATPSFLSLHP